MPLRGVAKAAVLCPPLHQQGELLGARLHVAALRQEYGVVYRGHGVHRQVDRDALLAPVHGRGRDHGDLRLVPAECRAAELEGARAHELIRARADGGLLELPGVQLRGAGPRGPAPLQPAQQRLRVGVDHDVHLGHRHPERLAAHEAAAREAGDLRLRDHPGDGALHGGGNVPDHLIALRRGGQQGHQLGHLGLPARALEGGRQDGHGAGLAHLGLQRAAPAGALQRRAAPEARAVAEPGRPLGAPRRPLPGRGRALAPRLASALAALAALAVAPALRGHAGALQRLHQEVEASPHAGGQQVRNLEG
mmetsp:Transcript_22472/g.59890  ORF Transcript_22472/g.59890 Transcript_22472/m.59890 type:complete len:307 (+) Transcript_22472:729-1649(+)